LTFPSSGKGLHPRDAALHLLNRLGFGPRPGDVDRVLEEGLPRAADRLLSPLSSEPAVERRLAAHPRIGLSIDEIVKEHQRLKESPVPIEETLADLRAAKVIRAVHAEHPLREVLADFWYNHFNVYAYAWQPSLPAYDREAIRPNCTGGFRALLHATAKHPAMLYYLDNYLSVADRMKDGVLVRGINENYGRELLELHTVGVEAGYTQEDVQSAARALTGWDFGGWGVYRFTFNPDKHDTGAKSVFGLELGPGGGQEDGDRLLDFLASHPATARYVSRRLVQRFVSDDPPADLVLRCAEVFLATHGDVGSLVKAIVESEAFWAPSSVGAKVKTPFEFAVSALRAVDAEVTDGRFVATALAGMGMPLYDCKPPTGYSNRGHDWRNAAAQVYRFDFAFKLAGGAVQGVQIPGGALRTAGNSRDDAAALTDVLAREVLGGRLSSRTRKVASRVRPSDGVPTAAKVAGLLLASPEFQMR
jgi:uncharacterized protein (DUF1800 family)